MANEAVTQAEELRQKAVGLLVAERSTIDSALARLGFDGVMPPPKARRTGAANRAAANGDEPAASAGERQETAELTA